MKKLRYTLIAAMATLLFISCDKVSPTGILIAETAVEDRIKMSYEYFYRYMDDEREEMAANGMITLLPHLDNCEGFFICRMERDRKED